MAYVFDDEQPAQAQSRYVFEDELPRESSGDESSSLWDIAVSGYQNIMGSRDISKAASNLNDLNDPEFSSIEKAKPDNSSFLGISGDELRRRLIAGQEGGVERLTADEQRRLDSGNQSLKEAGKVKLSGVTKQFLTGDGESTWWEDFAADPVTIVAEIGAQSAYGSVEALGTGLLMAPVGGPLAIGAGSGMGSGRIEFANTVTEDLRSNGFDVTNAENLRAQLSKQPEAYEAAKDKALKRAVAIGSLDAASFGIASKTLGFGTGMLKQVTNLGLQTGVQAGAGASGEALAQLVTEGEVSDGRAVAAEAVGELVTAPVDVYAATRKYSADAKSRADQPSPGSDSDLDALESQMTGVVDQGWQDLNDNVAPRIGSDDVIYSAEDPATVAQRKAQQEQRQADNFSAMYGQEGQTPYQQAPMEGDLLQPGQITNEEQMLNAPQENKLAGLQFDGVNKIGQEGMIYAGQDQPAPEAQSNAYEGVGLNVTNRQASMAPGLPQGDINRTIPVDVVNTARGGLQIPGKQSIAPQSAVGQDVAGEKIDNEWTAFAPETQTLNIPRAEMPQIKAEHRGAMVNFMNARGIEHQQEEIPANELKPTQAEFSLAKVKKAKAFKGGARSILISADNHVIDGHHQWLASLDKGETIKAIRLDAPATDLIKLANEFPSSETATGATEPMAAKPVQKPKRITFKPEKHSFAHAIAYSGGMNRQAAINMGIDEAHFKDKRGGVFGKPLFPKNGGLTEGELFETLSQEGVGYINTQEEFRARLYDHLSGKPHYTPDGYINQAEIEAEERAKLETKADPIVEGQTSEESLTSVAAFEAKEAGVSEDRIEQILIEFADNELDIALELRYEIDRVQAERDQAGNGNEGNARTGAQKEGFPEGRPTTAEEVWGSESDFELDSYTEQDLATQDEAKAKSEADAAAKAKAAQDKAQADSEVNDFTLSGSDRTADIAASRGQNDMFGASKASTSQTNATDKIITTTEDAVKAIRTVVETQKDVVSAVHRDDIGDIDFIWGDEGKAPSSSGKRKGAKGVSHILEARMRKDGLTEAEAIAVADEVAVALVLGDIVNQSNINGTQKTSVSNGRYTAWLIKEPQTNHWLLTGWKENVETSGEIGKGHDKTNSTHSGPTPTRSEEGAEASKKSIEQDKDTVQAPSDSLKTVAVPSTEQESQAKPASKIEDFGEVLEGANKHSYQFKEAIGADIDVKAVPLSKSFPQPDYEKLVTAGADPRVLAFVAQLRSEIKAKPRAKYKVSRWAETVESARSTSASLMDGTIPPEKLIERLENGAGHLKYMPVIMDLATEILPSQIKDLGSYKIEGHHYSIFRGEKDVDKIVVIDTAKKGGFGGMGNQQHFDTVDEAKAYIKGQVTTESDTGKPMAKFDIWTERGKDGYFIGKKLSARKYIELHKADSSIAAREYVQQHNDELVALLKKKKEVRSVRRAENNERVGKDYRSGIDVTPDLFAATFGFRGVQFGNWVENDKRQKDLNSAYDGLMDLAELIGVPPKALSFDGQLGLAFGARGKGGKNTANAHYEPSTIVINLTKKNGAGSLAHEWFHALDNYFGRMDGPNGEGLYLTEDQRSAYKLKVVDGKQTAAKTEPSDFYVRQEVYDAFKSLERAINKETKLTERSAKLDSTRSKDYWSTVREMTARSFERYVIDRLKSEGFESDYLANIVSEEDHQRINDILGDDQAYAYPLASEMEAVNNAYDNLFDVIDTKETESGVAMFSRTTTGADSIEALPGNLKPNAGLTVDAVRSAADRVARRLRLRGIRLNVVATEADLPAAILEQAAEDGAEGQIGAVYHDKAIHVVADRMRSISEVETAIFHEAAHYGGRALFGRDMVSAYNKLWMKIGGVKRMQALAEDAGLGDTMKPYFETADAGIQDGSMSIKERNTYLVDEFLAHMNQQQAGKNLPARIMLAIKEFIGAIRDAIRKFGFAELPNLSDSDLSYLLRKVRKAAQGSAAGSDRPHFMRVSDEERMDIELSNLADELELDQQAAADSSKPMFSRRPSTADQFDDLSQDQESFLGKIAPRTTAERIQDRIKEALNRGGLKFRQGVVDRYAALFELDKQVHGESVIEDHTAFSSWVLAKMSHAADGALAALMSYGRIQINDGVIELKSGQEGSEGLMGVLSQLGSGPEIERFLGWIAANRSQKLASEGRENLFTEEEVAAGVDLNRGTTKNGSDRSELYNQVFKEFQQYRDDVLAIADTAGLLRKAMEDDQALIVIANNNGLGKNLVDRIKRLNGKINQAMDEDERLDAAAQQGQLLADLRELLETNLIDSFDTEYDALTTDQRDMWANEFYVPFYRVMEEVDVKGPKISGGLSRQQAYKKLKGGNQELNDLLENTLMNFQHLLSASLKNNAARQAMTNAESVGIAEATSESSRDKKNSTFVLNDGIKQWYNIEDSLVFEALTSLNDPGTGSFSRRMMRSFKRIFTSFTTASPQFMVANGIRDTLHSMAIGNLSYNGFRNFAHGFKEYGSPVHKGRVKGDMLASGAAFSFGHVYGTGDADALHAELERKIKGAKVLRSPADVPGMMRKAWDYYSGFGDAFENANRASMFEQNMEKGKLYSAFQARDLMDFSSHGAWPAVRFLVDTVPFLNARIQGLDRMYRGGVKPSFNAIRHIMGGKSASISDLQAAKRFAIVVGGMTAASIALYLHNKDDDDYQELEDWQRDMYWFVRFGEHKFFIPKPFEVGAIATIAERGIEQMVDDTKHGDLFAERLGHVVMDTFSFNPTPQMVKPVLDMYANKDSFTGRPIESMGMDKLSKVNRMRSNTTEGAKAISKILDATTGQISESLVISPVQADYLIQGYLGWIGSMGAATVDVIAKTAQGQQSPSKEWYEYQPIRRFYKNDSKPGYTRYGTEFYKVLKEVDRTYADIMNLRKLGENEAAADLLEESGGKLRARDLLHKAQRTLSALSARAKMIQSNSKLSGDVKRRQLDLIRVRQTEIQKRIVDRVEAMQ
ncbi:LPD38 domain-containing protein [uncultured Amphritea sp.]|uniref:LPD38 domain-containing protein n=1 Tax=uncultured Amphritea sp. TaxID=981605 RepID=UPI00262B3CF6|nr:LPD38 domain-containing protein [uncultured Amphritea sp.]